MRKKTWTLHYKAQSRYGYIGIDLYRGDACLRTVITGIKPQKLGREFADQLQSAYEAGFKEAREVTK